MPPYRKHLEFHQSKHAKVRRLKHILLSAALFVLAFLAAIGAAWFIWWRMP